MSNDMPSEELKEMESLKKFSAEIAKTYLQPGQYNAVIRAYKDLRIYHLSEKKAKSEDNSKPEAQEKNWKTSSYMGGAFILTSFFCLAIYISNKFSINLWLIGSILLFTVGVLFIFIEKLKQRIL